jgi:CheY-like chemotaxis protein
MTALRKKSTATKGVSAKRAVSRQGPAKGGTALRSGATNSMAPKARSKHKALNSKSINILIIDDDLERRKLYYEQFFKLLATTQNSRFAIQLLWAETPLQAHQRVIGKDADLILLDMMLTGNWFEPSDSIYKAIKAVKAPLILLSEDFTSNVALRQIHKIFDDLRGTPILGFIPFSPWIREHVDKDVLSVPDPQVEVWNLAFHEALDAGRDHRWQPASESEITFLHLTDTHFGKTEPDYLNAEAIARGAAKHRLAADILLWTGDISNTGAPHEFRLAEKFLADLKGAGVLARNAPISMVPGNHDLCWPLALASRLAIDHDGPEWKWNLSRSIINKELWNFGFRPYADFFEQLVDADEPQKSGIGFRWLDQWAHRGFAILELPIEAHMIQSDKGHLQPDPLVTPEDFKRISENALRAIKASALAPEVCIVMLVHGRDPNVDPALSKRWVELRERLHEAGHVSIVFAGHEHEAHIAPRRRELTIVGVPNDSRLVGGSTLPGVYFVTLRGLNGVTPECKVTKLERRQDEISRAVVWKAQLPSCWGISGSTGDASNWVEKSQPPA